MPRNEQSGSVRNIIRIGVVGARRIPAILWRHYGLEAVQLSLDRMSSVLPGDTIHALVIDLDGMLESDFFLALRTSKRLGVPLLILTTEVESEYVTRLLLSGAEDVIGGTSGDNFVAARVAATARRIARTYTVDDGQVRVKGKVIDLAERKIIGPPAGSHPLSAQELLFLRVLLGAKGRAVGFDEVALAVGRDHRPASLTTIRRLVRKLREFLEADPDHPQVLLTVWGMGYRLATEDEIASEEPSA